MQPDTYAHKGAKREAVVVVAVVVPLLLLSTVLFPVSLLALSELRFCRVQGGQAATTTSVTRLTSITLLARSLDLACTNVKAFAGFHSELM